jgi:hypothetical protein
MPVPVGKAIFDGNLAEAKNPAFGRDGRLHVIGMHTAAPPPRIERLLAL